MLPSLFRSAILVLLGACAASAEFAFRPFDADSLVVLLVGTTSTPLNSSYQPLSIVEVG